MFIFAVVKEQSITQIKKYGKNRTFYFVYTTHILFIN